MLIRLRDRHQTTNLNRPEPCALFVSIAFHHLYPHLENSGDGPHQYCHCKHSVHLLKDKVITALSISSATMVGVSSRKIEKAEKFASENNAGKV